MADNQVTMVGSLGRDPEIRFTPGGMAVASSSLAVTRKYKKNDEWQEETSWFGLTVWGSLGENFAQSCVKGSRVIVTGRIEVREFEGRDGTKGRSTDITADEIGASLRWATVQIERTARTDSTQQQHGSRAQDSGYLVDEEPF
jgi:single-strand DNA-binding protein